MQEFPAPFVVALPLKSSARGNVAKQGILSRLLGGGKTDEATALVKGAPSEEAPVKGAPAKDDVAAKVGEKKAGPPYAITPKRQGLIDEALRVRAKVREDLGEERIKKLETIVKHKGGLSRLLAERE